MKYNNVCRLRVLQELEGLCLREVARLRVPVIQDGDVDALAVWFQLHLDKENSISTGPDEDTCWEQAIYPVPSRKTEFRGGVNNIQWCLKVCARPPFKKNYNFLYSSINIA